MQVRGTLSSINMESSTLTLRLSRCPISNHWCNQTHMVAKWRTRKHSRCQPLSVCSTTGPRRRCSHHRTQMQWSMLAKAKAMPGRTLIAFLPATIHLHCRLWSEALERPSSWCTRINSKATQATRCMVIRVVHSIKLRARLACSWSTIRAHCSQCGSHTIRCREAVELATIYTEKPRQEAYDSDIIDLIRYISTSCCWLEN